MTRVRLTLGVEREAGSAEPLFSLYGFLATRAGGALDTDSDFDFDETLALRAEGCSGARSETLKL
jgi:hypothetical protein